LTWLHCRWPVETLIDLFISLRPDRGASPGRKEGMTARVKIAMGERERERQRERERERERDRGQREKERLSEFTTRERKRTSGSARVFRHPFSRSLSPSRACTVQSRLFRRKWTKACNLRRARCNRVVPPSKSLCKRTHFTHYTHTHTHTRTRLYDARLHMHMYLCIYIYIYLYMYILYIFFISIIHDIYIYIYTHIYIYLSLSCNTLVRKEINGMYTDYSEESAYVLLRQQVT